jgi:hypothetical protein
VVRLSNHTRALYNAIVAAEMADDLCDHDIGGLGWVGY